VKKLHNGELNNMFFSPNIVRVIKLRRMRGLENVARMAVSRVVYRKSLIGRSRCKLDDNIKMDNQGVGWGHGLD
jgi:hypothetical protein